MLFSLLACSKQEAGEQAPSEQKSAEVSSALVPGRAEIKVSEDLAQLFESAAGQDGTFQTKSSSVNSYLASLGVKSVRRLFPDDGAFDERKHREGLHLWYEVEYDETLPQTKAASSLSELPGVEISESVRRIRPDAFFNDPSLSLQWDFYNHGFSGNGYTEGCDINVVPVWREYTTGDPSVIVAVVDGGIDYTHEDLAWNYLEGGYNFAVDNSRISAHDHGSHVAGTIAAVNNNGIGVSGIAGGDYAAGKRGVKLLSCQIFDDSVEGSGNGARAIIYGADHGAVISQNSWGYDFEKESDAASMTIPSSLKTAIDYFINNAGCDDSGNQLPDSPMQGGLVVFAASNDGWRYNPICEYDAPNLIAVGSVGADFNRAYYSNYGDWVDICAPGGDANKGPQIYSTLPGNKYGYFQGTSMACPHVSGVAALVVSYRGGQGYTADALREALLGSMNTTKVRSGAQIGGLVDALGAVTYGSSSTPAKVSSYQVSAISNSLTFTFDVTTDPNFVRAWGYTVYAAAEKSLLEGLTPGSSLPDGVKSASALVGDIAAGEDISVTLSGLDFDTPYYVAVAGYNYQRSFSALSEIKQITTLGNNPPVIEFPDSDLSAIRAFQTLNFPVTIYDPDAHSFSVTYTAGGAADSFNSQTSTVTIVAGNADPGDYTFTLTATDAYGLSTTLTKTYTILENQAPEKVKDIDNVILDGLNQRFTLAVEDYIADPDGESLSFEISVSDPSVVHLVESQGQFIGTSLKYGLVTVSVKGTDVKGLSASTSFQVLVKDPDNPVEVSATTVTDHLTIRTAEVKPTLIRFVGSTGKTVYEQTLAVGAFSPAVIDCKPFAPGIYSLSVSIDGGEEYSFRIIKI